MSNFHHIDNLTDLHEFLGLKKPEHPLVTVIDLSEITLRESMLGQKITSSFYNITMKTKVAMQFRYGRQYFDFAEGTLFGIAPDQYMEIDEVAEKGEMEGWSLYFHPDLVRGSGLLDKLENYGFFDYQTNEALHLSDKEKETLNQLIVKITEEYAANLDSFSKDILVSNIELLLNYINRFYTRQFLTRQSSHSDVLTRFQKLLKAYFNDEQLHKKGLPKVSYFAKALHFSDSYLSDLLKNETGKNTQEHIHHYLIEKAKNRLLRSTDPVSEIAFDLGFEYPQYFSRLFKKKTGMTPVEWRSGVN